MAKGFNYGGRIPEGFNYIPVPDNEENNPVECSFRKENLYAWIRVSEAGVHLFISDQTKHTQLDFEFDIETGEINLNNTSNNYGCGVDPYAIRCLFNGRIWDDNV